MQLTDEQKKSVMEWVKEGVGLSGIQKNLSERFGLRLTYLDVRFLLIEMGLQVKEKAPPAKPAADPNAEPQPDDDPSMPAGDGMNSARDPSGKVSVAIDRVTRPGTVVSGTAVFSDGISASWSIDQFGRLALQSPRPGYKPSADDVDRFQTEIRRLLQKHGF